MSHQDLMRGSMVLVTGGTGGIGRATAAGLAALGARVAIVGRERGRAEAAASSIRDEVAGADVDALVWARPFDAVGGADGFLGEMERYAAAGVQEVHVAPMLGDPVGFVQGLGTHVVPRLRAL